MNNWNEADYLLLLGMGVIVIFIYGMSIYGGFKRDFYPQMYSINYADFNRF